MSEGKKEFNSYLAKINDTYMPMIQSQMEKGNIQFSEYQRKCVLNAIAAINQLLDSNGINFGDTSLDQSNITQILFNVASLELNAVAEPSECFFQLRNVRKKHGDKDIWMKKIEMGIEGDGYDAILARFGRNVKKVYPYWLVREDDAFEYPKFNGLEMTPPKWEPKGTGKVVRVVYPILHDDDTLHFYISEREDVKKNLLAHINNNLMNETFGFAESKFKATKEQKAKIEARKKELKEKAYQLGLDAIEDEELKQYISPAWQEDFSQESMIIRKMRNNIVKKIPKDFGNPSVQESYAEATDERYRRAKEDIIEGTATVIVDDIAPDDGENRPTDGVSNENRPEHRLEEKTVSESELEHRERPDFS